MDIDLDRKLSALDGKTTTGESLELLQQKRITIPLEWREFLAKYPIAGARLSLSEDDDESGLGAEIQLMGISEILAEATEAYPGIVAVKCGFFPIGTCLQGSGDPYFIREKDGYVVRIPHSAVDEEYLDEDQVEEVIGSIKQFLSLVQFED